MNRKRLYQFMLELNASGFSNLEISRQCGVSHDYVDRRLRGIKSKVVWKLPSSPPLTKRWSGGSEEASMALKRMKVAIGRNLWWLWDVKTTPVTRRGPGRPAAVRPHRALVELAVQTFALVCGVSQLEVWKWIFPGRARHIYRHGSRD